MKELCGAPHPTREDRSCIVPKSSVYHAQHLMWPGRRGEGEPESWPNTEAPAPPVRERRKKGELSPEMRDIADKVKDAAQAERKIARDDDPWTSHLGAERIQPSRGSRKEQVLLRLLEAVGEWVNGTELATAECGGSEGLRRCRELRQDGWDIERRTHPTHSTIWQYRIEPPHPQPLVYVLGKDPIDFG